MGVEVCLKGSRGLKFLSSLIFVFDSQCGSKAAEEFRKVQEQQEAIIFNRFSQIPLGCHWQTNAPTNSFIMASIAV